MTASEKPTPLLDLFGDPLPVRGRSRALAAPAEIGNRPESAVLPCVPADDLIQLGAKLPPQLYLGTSSWSFPGWQGLVYAGAHAEVKLARDGLAAYGKHPLLRTVGIDRTFYAPIAAQDYARYAAQVPESFRFLVKAPMALTSAYLRSDTGTFSDSPFYFDPNYAISALIEPALVGLAGKAGPLVFQFPPQGREATADPDRWINRLYRFLRALPVGPLYAVEIRDPALLTTRFFVCLKTVGASFCVASHAKMPTPQEQITRQRTALGAEALTPAFVARWSLHAGFKYEQAKAQYAPFNRLVDEDLASRTALAAACLAALEAACPAFVIINNKAEGSAPLSVARLASEIVRERG